MAATTRYVSIVAFVEAEIGGNQWQRYLKVRDEPRESLRRRLPASPDEVAAGQLPYEDAKAAARYALRSSIEKAFSDEIIMRAAQGEWIVEGRDEDGLEHQVLDGRSLKHARFNYARNEIQLLGSLFEDVSITRANPEPIHDQMVRLVKQFVQENSPEDKILDDVRAFIVEQLGYKFPTETMDKAIAAAEPDPKWSKGGRRGSRMKGGNPPA